MSSLAPLTSGGVRLLLLAKRSAERANIENVMQRDARQVEAWIGDGRIRPTDPSRPAEPQGDTGGARVDSIPMDGTRAAETASTAPGSVDRARGQNRPSGSG